jgi:hypothetical protein
MRWIVVRLDQYTGDIAEHMHEYTNRGHAVSKVRGLVRKAWKLEVRKGTATSSDLPRYAIVKG